MGLKCAVWVKRSIMLKMADACSEHKTQTFHEMYVQRHNNVSILYADIVNFTPLSEQLSASDLVKTLNELFGRFDQIAQVKRSIMLKMADACSEHKTQTFHEMYVQRHNNVSILYADIVNFTPLSEQLSASDLVKTLNELFGRFDQIAQVSMSIPEDLSAAND
ncbi:hypothetical protein HUJ05_007539 [Dendroctonus ponderosae]|nr:hypothetical protein HUJ05_007539 [Dendroctonus ponderosae]